MKQIAIVAMSFLLLSCESGQQRQPSSWHGSMQGLANSLNDVMPDLIARSSEDSRLEKKQLDRAIKDLKGYAENLNSRQMPIPSRDPSLRFLAQGFKDEMNQISKSTSTDSPDVTRAKIHRVTNYCIACHTRIKASSSFFTGDMGKRLGTYSDFGKARFFTAVRQYEKAMVHYEKALNDKKWGKSNGEKWNQSALALLVLTVRVQDNPNLTVEMISGMLDSKAYPPSVEKAARVWRKDAQIWEKEKSKNYELENVQSLIASAAKKDKTLQYSGLLLYLRASKVLNKILDQGTLQGEKQQRYLFYSGLVSKRLARLKFVGFPESHFKACISIDPKSRTAMQCQAEL